MSRIENNLATQIGDVIRPQHTAADRHLQVQAAQAQQLQSPDAADDAPKATDLRAAAAQLKQIVETASSRRLSLKIDPNSDQAYMSVTDMATGEVVKQIPTKEVRLLHARLQEFVGLLLDKEA
jgi:flagellar protein FlaG